MPLEQPEMMLMVPVGAMVVRVELRMGGSLFLEKGRFTYCVLRLRTSTALGTNTY